MRVYEKELGNKISPYGKNEEFFVGDLHTTGKRQFYKKVFPQTLVFRIQHSN